MELPFDFRAEYIKCLSYTKTTNDSNELCLTCMTDETEDGHQWERYQIQCGPRRGSAFSGGVIYFTRDA